MGNDRRENPPPLTSLIGGVREWRTELCDADVERPSLVPLQHVQLAPACPIFCSLNITMPHRIILHVIPFLTIRLASAELAIPGFWLPDRNVVTVWPAARQVVFPERNPILQRLRRKCIGRAEDVEMVGQNDVATGDPRIGGRPGSNEKFGSLIVSKQRAPSFCADR